METACEAIRPLGLKGEVWPEAAEACWQEERDIPVGPVRPGPAFAIPQKFADVLCVRTSPPGDRMAPEDQNYAEGVQRICALRDLILDRWRDTDAKVVIFGHGHAGGRVIEAFMGWPVAGYIDHANCGHSEIEQRHDGQLQLRFANRTVPPLAL
jgi:hypothetical protein